MTINIGSSCSVPPGIEFVVPVLVELQETIVVSIVEFVVSSVHEVVQLITAVEVTASITWALLDLIACFSVFVPLSLGVRAAGAPVSDCGLGAASGVRLVTWASIAGRIVVVHFNGAASSTHGVSRVIEPVELLLSTLGDSLAASSLVRQAALGVITPVVITTFFFSIAGLVVGPSARGSRRLAAVFRW